MVSVVVKYRGHFKKQTGMEEEKLQVPSDPREAKQQIMEMVKTSYGIAPPVVMMMGGIHIARILKTPEAYPLAEGMEIILLPSISGG